MVGLPDKPLPEMMAQKFARNAAKLTGSHLGNNRKAIADPTRSIPDKLTMVPIQRR